MKTKKLLSIVLSMLLILFSFSRAFSVNDNTNSITEEPFQSEYDNAYNKLHFYFASTDSKKETMMRTSNDSASEMNEHLYIDDENELDTAIEVMDDYYQEYAEPNEPIIMTVEFRSNYEKTDEYNDFLEKREEVKTTEELRAFRTKMNEFSKEYHRDVTETYLDKLDSLNYNAIEMIEYSPFIRMTIDKDEISTDELVSLAKDDDVVNVSFSLADEVSDAANWNRTMREIGAYSITNRSTYTGEGIKIGVFEKGVCDTSHENLSDISIMTNGDNLPVTEHATQVTSIIAKMAPDAEIYVDSIDVHSGIAWFIDSGCDIINCSYSKNSTEPVGKNSEDEVIYEFIPEKAAYDYERDGLFDYQIKASLITVVAAAGNISTINTKSSYNPDGYITSPGLAHNVITVGGLDCSLGFFDYELEYHPNAAYKTVSNITKPEISALHEIEVDNFGVCPGTSFAAPQVTGIVALLMCKYVSGALDPHAIKSMLISGAKETENFTNINGSYFDDKVGAGCVNLDNMLDCEWIHYSGFWNGTGHVNSYVYSYDVTLKRNDILQASVSWLATCESGMVGIVNYDLHLYDSSDNLVCSSSLGNFTNSEFIRYKVNSKGTYTIKVYQNGQVPSNITSDQFAVACNIL